MRGDCTARPSRFGAILLMALALLSLTPTSVPAQQAVGSLGLLVERRPLTRPADVLFFGPDTPRVHLADGVRITEEQFFRIAGEPALAETARQHRRVNNALIAGAATAFFGGLTLFSTTRNLPWEVLGFGEDTPGRAISLTLLVGSLVPAITVVVRGQHSVALEVSFQTMQDYNGD